MIKRLSTFCVILLILVGCCNPERPVAIIKPYLYNENIDLKGYDCNCDNDIDYWQYYDGDTPIGDKLYTEGNYKRCENIRKK